MHRCRYNSIEACENPNKSEVFWLCDRGLAVVHGCSFVLNRRPLCRATTGYGRPPSAACFGYQADGAPIGTKGSFENKIAGMKEVLSHFSVGVFEEGHPAVKIWLDGFCVDGSPAVRVVAKDCWQFRAGYTGHFILLGSFSAQPWSAQFSSHKPRSPRPALFVQITTANGSSPSKSVNSETSVPIGVDIH